MPDLITTPRELPSPEVISQVLLGGDLSKLSPQQKISYYRSVCDSIGLNPLTKPFEFLRLSGREVLYATRNCTDQIRKIYGISITITAREVVEDTYVVTARATLPNGRHDESIGAVPIATLKGESRSNALMKCETKAKRRVSLSLIGLSTLDESEIESIPNAQPIPFNPDTLSPGRDALVAGSGERAAGNPASGNAPADTNNQIPASWQPFVIPTESMTGTIASGKRAKSTGRISIVLSSGEECYTRDATLTDALMAFKETQTPVTITTKDMPDGKEIVSLAEATDAAF